MNESGRLPRWAKPARVVLALAAMSVALPVLAEREPARNPSLDQLMDMSIDQLDAVVVTARRRPELLQKVPMAVTQFNAGALRDFQVQGLSDLQGLVPNIVATVGGSVNAINYIRGLGQQDSLFFADPGVGVYLDDVYLGCPQCASIGLFDLERVEVVRGPQGSLYGKNTIGGAIKYITRQPVAEREATLEASVGNFNQVESRVVLGGSLVEGTLLGRLAVSTSRRDGFARNEFTGKDDYDRASTAYRGALKWLLSRDASFQLTVDGALSDPSRGRTPVRITGVPDNTGGVTPAGSDPYRVAANYSLRDRVDILGVSGVYQVDLGDQLSLRSTTAYRRLKYDTAEDVDGTGKRILDVWYKFKHQQFSQEFKLNYTRDRLNGVFGLYYYRDASFAHDAADITDYMPAAYNFAGTASVYGQKTQSHAVFGELAYQWTERLSLSAGLRYTHEKKDFHRNFQQYAVGDLPTPDTGIAFHPGSFPGGTGDYAMHKSWASLSPRLGVNYQWTSGVLVYGSVGTGFKSGGFDGRAKSLPGPSNQPFDPEDLVSYEIGAKTSWLNDRLILNASAFYNDYRKIQVSTLTAGSLGQPVLVNAGKGVTRGLEIELTARPPIRDLTLRGALGLLHAEFKEYSATDAAGANVNVAGQRRFPHAPELTAMLGAVYSQHLRDRGTVRLGGDVRHFRGIYLTDSGSRQLYQNNYTLLNAFASYETADRRWLFTLAGKNLTKQKYRQAGFDFSQLGYQVAYSGDPRTVMLSALVRF